MWINELELQRLHRHKGHHFFLFWRAQSRGDWGETLPNKEARGGRWEGKEKGISRFSLSIVHIDRTILLEYEGGASAQGRSRGLCRPVPGYLPSSAVLFFFFFFFLPHFDPGRKQDSNQFHVFLFFHFLNIVTSYMKVWPFRFWSKWSVISYLDSGANIASSTKFLPVKRYFSSQLAKKPLNKTLICFIFLLLMHRFLKTVVWTPHICAKMIENPKQFPRFTDRKITIFTLGLQNADIDSLQLISQAVQKRKPGTRQAKTFHCLKWLSQRVSCSPAWRFCTT